MASTYDQGYAQALADLADEFASLADQAQGDIVRCIQTCRAARRGPAQDEEDQASNDLHEAMRLKLTWINALRITQAAEARHRVTQSAA